MAAALDDAERMAVILDTDPALLEATVGGPGVPLCPQAPGEHQYVYTLGRGRTAADVAAAFGSATVTALLAERGTPRQRLLAACTAGDRAAVTAVLRADPDARRSLSPADRARLPRAAWSGNAAAVHLMLDLGFDPAATDDGGGTALHAAAWQGQADVVELILSHPAVVGPPVRAGECHRADVRQHAARLVLPRVDRPAQPDRRLPGRRPAAGGGGSPAGAEPERRPRRPSASPSPEEFPPLQERPRAGVKSYSHTQGGSAWLLANRFGRTR